MSTKWPKVKLGEVLRYRKEFITIDDLKVYKRPRVKLHVQGIVLRDEVLGAAIKTKQQQLCHVGEFLVAEIDAKVGGFGIVPQELDGAIVSSHYFLFVIDEEKLNRCFLGWFIQTPDFREQVEAQGSTNYAAIRPSDVLRYGIPLPPLEEQQRIVARIEELAEQINEARRLRQRAVKAAQDMIVSVHSQMAATRIKKLSDFLQLDEDQVPVLFDKPYPQVGVKSFGDGLFAKEAVLGSATTYKAFNRLYAGALVLSQVKGWEGAIAVCPKSLEGRFVSPEYRTFRCLQTECRTSYLASIVKTEWFWRRLADATRGVGARRERVRPEQFLNLTLPMPEIEQQRVGEKLFDQIEALMLNLLETTALDNLLPSILDKAFKGRL